MRNRRHLPRSLGATVGLLATTAVTAVAVQPAAAQAASACPPPYIAILPAFKQNRDMALGFPDKPLADRDSKGISYAETWQETPTSLGTIKLRNRLAQNNVVAGAGVGTTPPVDAVISEPLEQADTWVKELQVGYVRYRLAGTNQYLTYLPGDPTAPFRVRFDGHEGQYFSIDVLGC